MTKDSAMGASEKPYPFVLDGWKLKLRNGEWVASAMAAPSSSCSVRGKVLRIGVVSSEGDWTEIEVNLSVVDKLRELEASV